MDYRELAQKIAGMSEDQKDSTVTVLIKNNGESFPVFDFVTKWPNPDSEDGRHLGTNKVDGVLDENHPYLVLRTTGPDAKGEIEQATNIFCLLNSQQMLNEEEQSTLDQAIEVLERNDLLDDDGNLIDEDDETEEKGD